MPDHVILIRNPIPPQHVSGLASDVQGLPTVIPLQQRDHFRGGPGNSTNVTNTGLQRADPALGTQKSLPPRAKPAREEGYITAVDMAPSEGEVGRAGSPGATRQEGPLSRPNHHHAWKRHWVLSQLPAPSHTQSPYLS